MKLENVNKTATTPELEVVNDNHIKLTGRSYPENVRNFYDPIINYVSKVSSNNFNFEIFLDYFNTASSKVLNEMFMHLDANNNIEKISVNWHYEEGDDDSLEAAEIFEETLNRVSFKYFEHDEVA